MQELKVLRKTAFDFYLENLWIELHGNAVEEFRFCSPTHIPMTFKAHGLCSNIRKRYEMQTPHFELY